MNCLWYVQPLIFGGYAAHVLSTLTEHRCSNDWSTIFFLSSMRSSSNISHRPICVPRDYSRMSNHSEITANVTNLQPWYFFSDENTRSYYDSAPTSSYIDFLRFDIRTWKGCYFFVLYVMLRAQLRIMAIVNEYSKPLSSIHVRRYVPKNVSKLFLFF